MQTITNRRVLTCVALIFAAVAVAIVLFAMDATSMPVWIGFAVGIAIAAYLALQWERGSHAERSNLR